jgi:sugar phosphate permease
MDTEKGEATTGSADIAASDASVSQVLTIDPKREAKLLRKLDLSIAPIVLVIFLAAYLDRANIGNAASAGMSEDIGMSSAELGSASIRYQISSFVLDTSLIITLQML